MLEEELLIFYRKQGRFKITNKEEMYGKRQKENLNNCDDDCDAVCSFGKKF